MNFLGRKGGIGLGFKLILRLFLLWVMFGVSSLSLVFHIRDKPGLICCIGHNLCTAIRQSHLIRSNGSRAISGFIVGKVQVVAWVLQELRPHCCRRFPLSGRTRPLPPPPTRQSGPCAALPARAAGAVGRRGLLYVRVRRGRERVVSDYRYLQSTLVVSAAVMINLIYVVSPMDLKCCWCT